MNRQFSLKDLLPYAIIIILLFLQFTNTSFFGSTPEDETVIDSVKVVKEIPQKQGAFQNKTPQPIVVVVPSNQQGNDKYINTLLSELNSIKDAGLKRDKILEALALRVYEKKYEDSTVTITVRDSINGRLKSQNVNWKIKPQKVSYFEKTITHKLKPKFVFSAGLGITSRLDSLANPQLQGVLGFKSKKGYELQLGISTDKRFNLTLKKDLFTKY